MPECQSRTEATSPGWTHTSIVNIQKISGQPHREHEEDEQEKISSTAVLRLQSFNRIGFRRRRCGRNCMMDNYHFILREARPVHLTLELVILHINPGAVGRQERVKQPLGVASFPRSDQTTTADCSCGVRRRTPPGGATGMYRVDQCRDALNPTIGAVLPQQQ